MPDTPRLFTSYSHDNQAHKDWVLNLSTRLIKNGIDVVLDQWDMSLASDLPSFMEVGLKDADRVLAICSAN
ncbi:toll/interleukin-1 receptor domain-containing protein [Kiloniella sp.]|uniref:toll/interleukin-1 receptor domain-containing protein n=1 Tax=Kiloniella sp. TaxID=1938587 RepID=UPI003B019B16